MAKKRHHKRRRRHYKRNPGFPLLPVLALAAVGVGIYYWKFADKDKKPETQKGLFLTDTRGMLLGPGQSAGYSTMISGRI